jgi:nucleoside-diphosphate-sugar epimerase
MVTADPAATILVTGAGGFLGGRVVEVLHERGQAVPRAGVRRWASAARLGRYPVDLVACDVLDPARLDAAMDGVAAVVHCAAGSAEVNVSGTRNVLEAARNAGVRRVVHLSTIDVYGRVDGDIDERMPLGSTGTEYGISKTEAERVCHGYIDQGLEIAILRPTILYGPFSTLWTAEYTRRLQQHPWSLPAELAGGTCNLVYVDDVVAAILLALDRPDAPGEAFNVNGPDRPSWHEYFEAFNDALGLPPLEPRSVASARLRRAMLRPVRHASRLAKPAHARIRALSHHSSALKRTVGSTESAIRGEPNAAELQLYGRVVSYSAAKARRVLGFQPQFPMNEGVALSAQWAIHHGYVQHDDPVTAAVAALREEPAAAAALQEEPAAEAASSQGPPA